MTLQKALVSLLVFNGILFVEWSVCVCVSIGVLVLLFLIHPLLMDPCQLGLCQHRVTDTKKCTVMQTEMPQLCFRLCSFSH